MNCYGSESYNERCVYNVLKGDISSGKPVLNWRNTATENTFPTGVGGWNEARKFDRKRKKFNGMRYRRIIF
jgi:hypothetical protein